MEVYLNIAGFLLVALALIHIGFPRYFEWRKDLGSITLINRQMMYIHTFFIGFVVLLMGILCLTSSKEILETVLGKRIALGFSIFWTLRLFIQFIGYSPRLWKGKTFETAMHVVFTIIWVYLSALFIVISR
jgi:hypothetical protein